ncbi:hypothetical protein IMZ11_20435 [Microtetraspora sp. AC03309]|uniref:hypothetical protein n=1 Tax=Microtetraspora sp. AC03309 TaxID=2779376 RepID=UPI001E51DF41|nr:hypothetical protein [Microtetraspora sp. AC03309]MCC5577998.1 hypothetical protein [Microtetraspora sp. AC03309]
MTDARLDRLVERIAPDPGPGMTPLALDLLDEITSAAPATPARPRRWRSWFVRSGERRPRLVAAAGALAALLAVTAGLGVTPASAALDIEREGDEYVVTVNDLFAEPAMYQRELRARGLSIELQVIPVSAGTVGQLLVLDGTRTGSGVTRMQAPGECARSFGCPIGLRIPVNYRKDVVVFLGRPARAGERYGLMISIDSPGEPFHCVDFINKTVAEVEPMLRARGLKGTFTAYQAKTVPGDWYVYAGTLTAPGEALMVTNPVPNPSPRPIEAFCPDGPDGPLKARDALTPSDGPDAPDAPESF